MLVLTRKVNEQILIGDDVSLMVVAIDEGSGKVRLGISAPRTIRIDREEVHRRRLAERDSGETSLPPAA